MTPSPRFTSRLVDRWFSKSSPVSESGAKAPRGRIIAVASGKGGTGKSFVTANLAVVAAKKGRRAHVVDCDFGLGNAHLLLGVHPELTIQHVLSGAANAVDACLPTPFGPALLAAGSGVQHLAALGPGDLSAVGDAVTAISAVSDVVLLDCAAGLSPQNLTLLLAADEVVLVTNPEIAALTDAYALLKCLVLEDEQRPVRVVVNRVVDAEQGDATFARLDAVSRRFTGVSLHYLGAIFDNPAVTQRRLGQAPVQAAKPSCPTSRAVQHLWSQLVAAWPESAVKGQLEFSERLQSALSGRRRAVRRAKQAGTGPLGPLGSLVLGRG